jgi:hypothetical protein
MMLIPVRDCLVNTYHVLNTLGLLEGIRMLMLELLSRYEPPRIISDLQLKTGDVRPGDLIPLSHQAGALHTRDGRERFIFGGRRTIIWLYHGQLYYRVLE